MRHRLLIAGAYAVAVLATAVLLRKELHWWMDRDTRPCPTCQAIAFDKGQPFIDEQGHRLRFATPELAARYAQDYAER